MSCIYCKYVMRPSLRYIDVCEILLVGCSSKCIVILKRVCKTEVKSFPMLTYPTKCLSHAEYHYFVTVYRSDLQSELQSVSGKFNTYRAYSFPFLTHPSTYCSHAEYHYCLTVYRSDVQSELQI